MAVPHSTFKKIHDRVCDLLGLLLVTDENFTQDNIDRPQLQIKRFISLFQQMALRMMQSQFNTLTFDFATAPGLDTYELANETCIECISYHTVRNLTSGLALHFMSPKEFRDAYPQGTPTTESTPIIWIPKYGTTADGGGVEVPNRMQLSPIPNDVYTIEYHAKVLINELTDADSKMSLPPHWEDVLIMGAFNMYKNNIGQGDWSAYVQEILSQVSAQSKGPLERKMAVSFGEMKIGPGRMGSTRRIYDWNYW